LRQDQSTALEADAGNLRPSIPDEPIYVKLFNMKKMKSVFVADLQPTLASNNLGGGTVGRVSNRPSASGASGGFFCAWRNVLGFA